MCMTLAPHVLDPEIKDRGTSAGVMMMHAMDHSGHDAHATPTTAPQGESLVDTLRVKRRYALGEITREQFEEMKHALGVPDANSSNEHAHH